MNGIKEVMENDDVDIVVVGKDGGRGRIGKSDLKFNHINDIQFDRKTSKFKSFITILYCITLARENLI